MKSLLKIAGVLTITLIPAFGDTMPLAGSASGTFSNPSSNGGTVNGNTWNYDTSQYFGSSTLVFSGNNTNGDGNTITGNTTLVTDLGTLTDHNDFFDNTNKTVSATLTIGLTFTTPSGGNVSAPLTIGVNEVINPDFPYSSGDSVIDLSNFNGPSYNFTVGSEVYTVKLDGFYTTGGPGHGTAVTSFDTANASSNDADLWATITSAPAATPEPVSFIMLGSIAGLIGLSTWKRSKTVA